MHLENQKATIHSDKINECKIQKHVQINLDHGLLFNSPIDLFEEYSNISHISENNKIQGIEQLQSLLKKYENEPTIISRIASVYRSFDYDEFADQIIENNYRQFPLSVFARCDYAHLCLDNNRLKEAGAAFDYIFDIGNLYPKRSSFHILEIIEFEEFLINYFCAIKDFERAIYRLNILRFLTKSCPITKDLTSFIIAQILQEHLSAESIDTLFKEEQNNYENEENEKEEDSPDAF